MNFIKKIAVVAFLVLLMSGCAASYATKQASDQTIHSAPADKAQIVFMRTSFVGGAVQTQLLDTTDGELTYLGGLDWGNKMVHLSPPGNRTFMVTTGPADFINAELEAGKTYYVHVISRYVQFALRPYRTDGSGDFNTSMADFKPRLRDTTLMMNTPEALIEAEKNMAEFKKSYDSYWPKWKSKTQDEKAELTLLKTDGV